jgi:hypothetical protein
LLAQLNAGDKRFDITSKPAYTSFNDKEKIWRNQIFMLPTSGLKELQKSIK